MGYLRGMATRAQVSALLDRGHSYETAGRALNIPAGRAFMIATGRAADEGGAPPIEDPARKPALPGSTQQLVNPPVFSPRRRQQLLEWVTARAARELKRGS